MSLMCAYQNCLCIKYPCSSIAFFKLPTDDRRSAWIKNSGNKTLINLSAKSSRFFCENHFRECDIRSQFNRKLLRKYAVPIAHESCKVQSEETESIAIQDRLHKNVSCDVPKENRDTHFDIEKLDDDSTTIHLYEEIEPPSMENQSDENTAEEEQENTYNLTDFYSTVEEEEAEDPVESDKEHTHREDSKLDDLEEIFYEETNSNHVDSSTLELHAEADAVKPYEELHITSQIPVKKRKFNEDALIETPTTKENPTFQVTTPNQDYEEDKHFALSLVGYFQRLHKRQKALAKLKILQYLTELELGLSSNL